MKLMERLKKAKENKKGFTLVELIVVIVILGILAAILIPSFAGYMRKANDAQARIEARSLYLAGKTIAAENRYELEETIISKTDEATEGSKKEELDELAGAIDKLETYTVTITGEEVKVVCKSTNGVAINIPETQGTTTP